MMNLVIIGGGAIGLLIAANLAKGANQNVTVITRTEEQAAALSESGIGVYSQGRVKIASSTAHRFDFNQADAVIITVKQYHLPEIASLIRKINLTCPLFFIQNGMSHLSFLSGLDHHHIFVGTIEHGVKKMKITDIQHNGVGSWKIAAYRGDLTKAAFLSKWDSAVFPIEFAEDYKSLLTVKLIKNLMINPFTTLYNVRNGELISNPFLLLNMHALYEELEMIFAEDIQGCSFEDIKDLCNKTADNQSSMLSDVLNGRKTEVEALTGYAMKQAELKNVKAPVLTLLHNSILAIQYKAGYQ
ncbi:2-dehydropantoate 2-reductase [Jeotgalibacillus sp. R-1-5s-1]|uniref:2-dehydropantoate 2-reductase n=1 Tax=Jeotgalibacillus sp. R-1-5s-1 TaxID=2555897 RepID=UPI00141B4B45|nr:2-dehydropantoate 2-reductase [Jeotgalibacillus sp. R-1-5s-1]